MQVSRKVMRHVVLRRTIYTRRIRVVEREEREKNERERKRELFTESFIYRRQIDSLSDQSVRPARKLLWLPPMPFLFDYFSSSAAGLGSSHPPGFFLLRFLGGINNFYRPSGRRNGKRQWAFNLLRVWRVLRGFPRRKCKDGATYRNATLLLLWRYEDADENRTTVPSNFGFDGGSARCRN